MLDGANPECTTTPTKYAMNTKLILTNSTRSNVIPIRAVRKSEDSSWKKAREPRQCFAATLAAVHLLSLVDDSLVSVDMNRRDCNAARLAARSRVVQAFERRGVLFLSEGRPQFDAVLVGEGIDIIKVHRHTMRILAEEARAAINGLGCPPDCLECKEMLEFCLEEVWNEAWRSRAEECTALDDQTGERVAVYPVDFEVNSRTGECRQAGVWTSARLMAWHRPPRYQ